MLLKIDSKEFLANVKQSRSQLQNLVASVLPDIKLDFPENFLFGKIILKIQYQFEYQSIT